jgi:hypothetical protein
MTTEKWNSLLELWHFVIFDCLCSWLYNSNLTAAAWHLSSRHFCLPWHDYDRIYKDYIRNTALSSNGKLKSQPQFFISRHFFPHWAIRLAEWTLKISINSNWIAYIKLELSAKGYGYEFIPWWRVAFVASSEPTTPHRKTRRALVLCPVISWTCTIVNCYCYC